MMIVTVTPELRASIAEFCQRKGIAKFALFDPDLQGRPNPHVDVYALVEFAPGVQATDFSWWYGDLEEELEKIVCYRTGVRTASEVRRTRLDDIVAAAEVLYASA